MKEGFVAIIISIVSVISSCSESDHNIKQHTPKFSLVSLDSANSIYKEVIEQTPLFIGIEVVKGQPLIFGVHEDEKSIGDIYHLNVIESFAKKWQKMRSFELGGEYEWVTILDSFQLAIIDSTIGIYTCLKSNMMGSAAAGFGDIDYYFISLEDGVLWNLNYSGDELRDGRIDGRFRVDSLLKLKSNVLKFLESKATLDSNIYRPSAEDLDLKLWRNYAKRWKIDNPSLASGYSGPPNRHAGKLTRTFYDRNLMALYEDSDYNNPSLSNDRFKIWNLFRGSILAYDSNIDKYFPVLIESCNHGCNKNIAFSSKAQIEIVWYEAPFYSTALRVNLESGEWETFRVEK